MYFTHDFNFIRTCKKKNNNYYDDDLRQKKKKRERERKRKESKPGDKNKRPISYTHYTYMYKQRTGVYVQNVRGFLYLVDVKQWLIPVGNLLVSERVMKIVKS